MGVDRIAQLRAQPGRAALLLDVDGTLAPIVADPQQSRPEPGTVEALCALAGRGVQLAVITGRDVATVIRLGGLDAVPGLVVAGVYGAELWRDGVLDSPPTPAVIETLRDRLPQIAARGDRAVWVEDKRLSLVVHGRMAADPEAALDPLREPIAALAAELGLEVHPGRGIIELRLPGYDKGAVLRRLVDRYRPRVVVFAGDDRGDLPALRAVHDLDGARPAAVAGFAVGAGSAEVPEIAAAADVLVEGPAGMLDLLRRLAAAP
jgi:trehalose 6-phosphate phosphatase